MMRKDDFVFANAQPLVTSSVQRDLLAVRSAFCPHRGKACQTRYLAGIVDFQGTAFSREGSALDRQASQIWT